MPNIVERAKSVCVSPDSTWAAIANERTEAAPLITGYVLPLAGAAAVAQAIGLAVVGQNFGLLGTYRMPITTALGMAVASLVFAAVGVVLMSIIIDALAPTFGAERSREQALKVAVYLSHAGVDRRIVAGHSGPWRRRVDRRAVCALPALSRIAATHEVPRGQEPWLPRYRDRLRGCDWHRREPADRQRLQCQRASGAVFILKP